MLRRSRKTSIVDAEFGSLLRRHGAWRARVQVDSSASIPLSLPGSRSGPDEDALVLARSARDEFARSRLAIDAELADHRSAYEPEATTADRVAPSYVAVIRLDDRLVLEFGYHVPWDEDHMLGARVSKGKLIELNGSVLEP